MEVSRSMRLPPWLTIGGAQVSELHSNFLINLGSASAADIETLGETVREKVKENSGIDLEWRSSGLRNAEAMKHVAVLMGAGR